MNDKKWCWCYDPLPQRAGLWEHGKYKLIQCKQLFPNRTGHPHPSATKQIVQKMLLDPAQLCNIHHNFAVTLYTPGACVEWSESSRNTGRWSAVLVTRNGILVWPIRLQVVTTSSELAGAGPSWVVLVLECIYILGRSV